MRIFLGDPEQASSPLIVSHRHPKLVSLGESWEAQRLSGRYRVFPSAYQFTSKRLEPWAGHISLIEMTRDPSRLWLRRMGETVIGYAGGDYTGRCLDDAFDEAERAFALQPFRDCLESGRPVYDRVTGVFAGAIPPTIDRLFLPLAGDGTAIDAFLIGMYPTDAGARQETL